MIVDHTFQINANEAQNKIRRKKQKTSYCV